MRTDVNFDGVAEEFERDIYATSKGVVRTAVLWDQMAAHIPLLDLGPCRVLDAGGGSGHLSVRLAGMGHTVALCDVSEEMLDLARDRARNAGVEERMSLHHVGIQDLPDTFDAPFDVVLCHAVLEWLGDPRAAVAALRGLVRPGGYLSLMFWNRNAAVLKAALRGEFEAASLRLRGEETRSGWGEGATPLSNEVVGSWLGELGFLVVSRSGVRVVHDHLDEALRGADRIEALVDLERALGGVEPFASLGQHTHYVCQVPEA